MNNRGSISNGRAAQILAAAVVILALYLAQDILIPMALAVLISFLLFPLSRRLLLLGLPRALSVAVTVLLATMVAAGLGYLVFNQACSLGEKIPDYRENLIAKVRSLKGGHTTMNRIGETIADVQKELASTQPAIESKTASSGVQPLHAVPVQVMDSGTDYLAAAQATAGPLLHPVAVTGIVFLLVIFILLGADELRDRLIWLAGARKISLTTNVMDDIGTTISRFLRTQLLVNASYGLLTALAMWIIGVPNAMLWGLLAALLRYVPFVGPWVAMTFPLLLSIATSASWAQPIYVVTAFIVCEAVINGLVEPWCYSGTTGMTAWGVVLSGVVWAWLWGPLGLILAVPITTCLVVLGKYVPHFSFFTRCLGSGQVLQLEDRLYQRLLVWDETGTEAILKSELEKDDASPELVADTLLIPVLETLKHDVEADTVTDQDADFIVRTFDQMEQLGPFLSDGIVERPAILLVSGPARADEITSRILARLATAKVFTADIVKSAKLASEVIQRVRQAQPFIICLVQSAPISIPHATYLLKLLRSNFEESRLLFAGLSKSKPAANVSARVTAAGANKCFHQFSEVLQYLSAHEPLRRQVRDPESTSSASSAS